MDDDTFFPKLSQNLLEILTNDNEYYDTIIEVGNDPYKNDEILTHIKLPNISPEIFQIILRYIYGGRISLKEYDTLDIINILVATNELSLQELITHLQSYLIKNEKHWMEQNFNLIYQISFENDSFSKLQNFWNQKKSKNIDLKIITNQHAELILKWIDKLEITDELDYPYEFELIFHGSRDGFSSRKFHEICDNKFHTITIIKVKDSNEILGGYNPDKNGIDNYILSRVIEGEYAIYNSIDFGPYFGFKDLYLCGEDFYDKSSCDSSDYEKPIRETNDKFSVEEYEIFQIMKNYIT
ncbi:BTB/POZ protein [Rhizophagus clarus]|uniref:BTB/POZ protein n=1 Tax=Rhizophagus clarus TaxID=94130 RepID=A0A8H3LFI1_9GLOM|nr:BTB/POZ protein [Rhizophagus clarus]